MATIPVALRPQCENTSLGRHSHAILAPAFKIHPSDSKDNESYFFVPYLQIFTVLLLILCPAFLFSFLCLLFISECSVFTFPLVVQFSCGIPHILPCTPGHTSVHLRIHQLVPLSLGTILLVSTAF